MLPDPSPKGSERSFFTSEILPLSAIIVLAALLRVFYLTSKSLWMDEGFSIFLGQTSTANFIHTIRGSELNMVFYYELLRGWMHFGSSEFFIRMLSVIPSVATVPVVYFLGRRLLERRSALVAALLAALHPAHIAYAQEARGYALAMFLIALSSLFFLRLLEQPGRRNWTAYVLFTTLAIYTHIFAGLVVLAQWAAYFIFSKPTLSRNTILKAALALAVCLAPMTIFVLTMRSAVANWIERPTWHDVVEVFRLLTLPKYWMVFYFFLWGTAVWSALRKRRRSEEVWAYQFLFAWLFVPVILTVTVSLYRPLLVPRFLLISVPAALLVAAAGLSLLKPWFQALVLAAVVLASFHSVLSYYRHPQLKEDWRGASQYVLAQSQAGDSIVVLPAYGRFTFDYYRGTASTAVPLKFVDLDSLAGDWPMRGERIWLVAYAGSNAEAQQAMQTLRNAQENAYCELKSKQLNFIQVRLFERCE